MVQTQPPRFAPHHETGGGKKQPAHSCHFRAGAYRHAQAIPFIRLRFQGCEYSAISARKLNELRNQTTGSDIGTGRPGNRALLYIKKTPTSLLRSSWCGAGSNRRHKDFQSFALPTELPHLINYSFRFSLLLYPDFTLFFGTLFF